MRLTCPDCAVVYEVPTDRLRPGRRIRCARCGTTWAPELTLADVAPHEPWPQPQQEAEASAVREPAPMPAAAPGMATALDRLAAAPDLPRARSVAGLRAAWAASILLLLCSAAATYVWRTRLVAVWPPAARILGKPAAPETATGKISGRLPKANETSGQEPPAHAPAPSR